MRGRGVSGTRPRGLRCERMREGGQVERETAAPHVAGTPWAPCARGLIPSSVSVPANPPLSSNLASETSRSSQHPPRRRAESARRRQSLSMEARGAGAEGPGAWQAVLGLVAARRTLVLLSETGAGGRGDRKPTSRPGQRRRRRDGRGWGVLQAGASRVS